MKITENPIKDLKYWSEIPSGNFVLGSPVTELCRGPVSEIQVEVTLTHPFLMKKTEVTQGEWEAVGYRNPEPRKAKELPFASANWYEALAFCNRISELEGLETCYDLSSCKGRIGSGCPKIEEGGGWKCSPYSNTPKDLFVCEGNVRKYETDPYACEGYRLPTRAEWEYAARAATTTATYIGDITTDQSACVYDPAVDPIAWYCHNSDRKSQPVGQKQPNAWGLYDMIGNLLELTDDVSTGWNLAHNEGKEGPLTDPVGAPIGVDDRRTSYGGAYIGEACYCKAARIFDFTDSMRISFIGFRPVKTIQTQHIDSGVDEADGGTD